MLVKGYWLNIKLVWQMNYKSYYDYKIRKKQKAF